MTEKPILFSGEMVQAILEGRKTQTRRLSGLTEINKEPDAWHFCDFNAIGQAVFTKDEITYKAVNCPYNVDRLWVKEAWRVWKKYDEDKPRQIGNYPEMAGLHYECDGPASLLHGRYRPSLFMPRWASRLILERVKDVRVERLHNISEDDARAEGIMFHDGHGVGHSGWRHDNRSDVFPTARESFAAVWALVNGLDSLRSNPWVWVVVFKRVTEAAKAA